MLFGNLNLYIKNKGLDCHKKIDQKQIFTFSYTPIKAVAQLILLHRKTLGLAQVKSNLLVFHSKQDHVADYKKSFRFLKDHDNCNFVTLQNSYHYLLQDQEQEEIFTKVFDCIKSKQA